MMPLRGQDNCAARRARAALAKIGPADIGRHNSVSPLVEYNGTLIMVISGYAYEGLSVKPRPEVSVMRQPQDDLLIVYALSLLAQEHKGTQKEDWALNLAVDIADQHGLVVSDAVRQLE